MVWAYGRIIYTLGYINNLSARRRLLITIYDNRASEGSRLPLAAIQAAPSSPPQSLARDLLSRFPRSCSALLRFDSLRLYKRIRRPKAPAF